ncbi:MAG TPA: hypothetical protein VMT89_05640, partial [Candidatus Acidoferrales bacterium]|nr:hypothetical protein [Candidatus Acidoferrales bacterium]
MRWGWMLSSVTSVMLAVSLLIARDGWSSNPDDSHLSIQVHKSARELLLQDGDRLVRKFSIVLGVDPKGGKLY